MIIRAQVITPAARAGQEVSILISRGYCRVGQEVIDMKPDSARVDEDNNILFIEENDGSPGTEWRFKRLS